MGTVISAVYTLSTNGGRHIVNLSNGWQILGTVNSADTTMYFYKSTDFGATWNQLCYINGGYSELCFLKAPSLTSYGTKVYALFFKKYGSDYRVFSCTFDATTVTNSNQSYTAAYNYSLNYNEMMSHSLTISNTGTVLYGAFTAEKDSATNHPQLYHLYSTNNGASWTSVNLDNDAENDQYRGVSIAVMSNGNPIISYVHYDISSSANTTYIYKSNGTSWSRTTISAASTYSADCTCLLRRKYGSDPNRLWLCWHGTTTAYSTIYNTHATYSDDNGVNWSTVQIPTIGSTVSRYYPVLSEFSSGDTAILLTKSDGTKLYYVLADDATGSAFATTENTLLTAVCTNPTVVDYPIGGYNVYACTTTSDITSGYFICNNPPNPPTLDAKSNYDANENGDFSWTFNDPDIGDSQTAYQFILKDSANVTILDTGKSDSILSSMSLGAYSLTNERTYHWTVRTYDQSTAVSSYPAYDYFYTVTPPVCTINYPTGDNTALIQGAVSCTWTFGSTGGNTQSCYKVNLTNNADTLLWTSGLIAGSTSSIDIDYDLQNDSIYKLKVALVDSKSMSSTETVRTFSTNFTYPAEPTLTATNCNSGGYIDLAINNPEPLSEMTNEAINSNFTSTANWTAINATMTINSGVCTLTGNGAGSDIRITQTSSITYAEGKRIYGIFTGQTNSSACRSFYLRATATGMSAIYADNVINPVKNTSYRNGVIVTCGAGGSGVLNFECRFEYDSITDSDTTVNTLEEILILDVSKLSATWQAMTDAEIIAELGARVNWFDGIQSPEPSVTTNYLFRKLSSDVTWTEISDNVGTSYKDYNVASGKTYWYKVQAIGSNLVKTDSDTADSTLTLKGIWLHDVYDPENTVYNFKTFKTRPNSKWQAEAQLMKFSGRTNPVAEFGEIEEENVNFTLDMTTNSNDVNAIDELIKLKTILCYRDARGRKVFGIANSTNPSDSFYGYTNPINIMRVDYDEEV